MLTGYTICVSLKRKMATKVPAAYVDTVCAKFGGSSIIHSDNGTKFKNQLFSNVGTQLGVGHNIYSPPYHPQSNRRIEGFHTFLKVYMSKKKRIKIF